VLGVSAPTYTVEEGFLVSMVFSVRLTQPASCTDSSDF
jgi:hypothetical protein